MNDNLAIAIALFLVLILPIYTVVSFFRRRKQNREYAAQIAALTEQVNALTQQVEQLESENSQLKTQLKSTKSELQALKQKYQPVINAETEAQAIQLKAKELLARTQSKAHKLNVEAQHTAQQLTDDAQAKADHIISTAHEEAAEAMAIKAQSDRFEATAKAMKNIIDGYGDEYIVPNHSLLDELADEFSHKDAGEKLKATRKMVREAIKNNRAADCDYVQPERREFAMNFVTDAFNGKVDSILAKVKHNNYGKLEQAIKDAFNLVNYNGKPFRDARITPDYLDLRQQELQWAVKTHELRQIELEEQREIRQQIREEEKARREIEKAIKSAEKEERLLQQAMKKARAELQSASDEQKAQYELQLSELEQKLIEAEQQGQRALSMAQQTRRGHVYIISNIGSFGEDVFKIGMTRRLEPLDRVKELGDASVPFAFDVHAIIYSEDAPNLEKELHHHFNHHSVNKVNPRKEFFNLSILSIKDFIAEKGYTDVHWTMKAEAQEYRESLAIAKAGIELELAEEEKLLLV